MLRRRVLVASLTTLLVFGSLAGLAAPAGALTGTLFFKDDFRGFALKDIWDQAIMTQGVRWCASASLWVDGSTTLCDGASLTPPYGTVTVVGGEAAFDNPTGTAALYVWRGAGYRTDPFPATGDFKMKIRYKGLSLGGAGNPGAGFVARYLTTARPVLSHDPGTSPSTAVFAVWTDSTGTNVWLLGQSIAITPALGVHDIKLTYVGGVYTVEDNGVPLPLTATSAQMPDVIQLGNPLFSPTAYDWADFSMDFVRVYT